MDLDNTKRTRQILAISFLIFLFVIIALSAYFNSRNKKTANLQVTFENQFNKF
jgi:hypothetical protein